MSLNGQHASEPAAIEREDLPLRLVVFGQSIVSEVGNPRATTSRAICRALLAQGHDVTFLEDRRNEALVRQMREHGAGPLLAASAPGTALPYRTYDTPAERERNVWLGREATTADAFLVLHDTPPEIREAATALAAPHLIRLCEVPSEAGSITLQQPDGDGEMIPYGPAVLAGLTGGDPAGITLLTYASADETRPVAAGLDVTGVRVIASGEGEAPDGDYVPEERLAPLLATANLVVVLPGTTGPGWQGRALLPIATGARSLVVTDEPVDRSWPFLACQSDGLLDAVGEALRQPVPALPPEFDASILAARIAGRVRALVDARWGR